jgi:hypothetical protein
MLVPISLAISGMYGVPLAGLLVMFEILLSLTLPRCFIIITRTEELVAEECADGKRTLNSEYITYLVNAMIILTTI